MIGSIKSALIENPSKLIEFLSVYGYCNFTVKEKYISFGRDKDSSPKSIVIRRNDNNSAFVQDYARGLKTDIISFVVKQKGASYSEVCSTASAILGNYAPKTYKPFGGILDFKKRTDWPTIEIEPLNNEELERFPLLPNKRFIKDGISKSTQEFFNIRFDQESDDILIPIYDPLGRLMGIKARRNRSDSKQKYYYRCPCQISQTLYGYSHNYEYLFGAKGIVIVEAEKSVMQAFEFGFREIVAIGGSSLSKTQARLIAQLNPKKIVLMLDKGISEDAVMFNILMLKKNLVFRDTQIYVWIPASDVPDKASPTDLGKYNFVKAVKNDLVKWETYERTCKN